MLTGRRGEGLLISPSAWRPHDSLFGSAVIRTYCGCCSRSDLLSSPDVQKRDELNCRDCRYEMTVPVAQKEPFKSSFVLLLAGHISHACSVRQSIIALELGSNNLG